MHPPGNRIFVSNPAFIVGDEFACVETGQVPDIQIRSLPEPGLYAQALGVCPLAQLNRKKINRIKSTVVIGEIPLLANVNLINFSCHFIQ